MVATKKTGGKASHALFWQLIKEIPGYDPDFKEEIKEGLVGRWTNGKTLSLSEMYARFPRQYSLMIEDLKGDSRQRAERYDRDGDMWRKRVLASIYKFMDRNGLRFYTDREKTAYAKRVACRASNCDSFNKIPISRLTSIYNQFVNMNNVSLKNVPEVGYKITRN